ncbi:hypothetical protein G6F57_019539 [Rhizopus arrhizus]|nr:hypothetical protein G6F57_019539 [Rhizopus arrhizus]
MGLSALSTVGAAAAAGGGSALGRAPLIDEDLASGRLVPLMPQLRMPGSWGYVMRIHANRPMDASLPALAAMNVILRPAWLAWVVLPLCLLALAAGKASAQTSTPGDALADWVANGRALGLVRPDTPCQDFLKTLGKKPDYVEYLGCEQDDDSYIQPMEARYRVSGAFAAEMEAYLGQTFGMPPLEYRQL